MLSILIPIYNCKVEKLVKGLIKQCNGLKINYEILCFDDGSHKKYKYENSILSHYFRVNYTELSENLGRAKIRNWMAKCASFENILFLDCDSKLIKKDFIASYWEKVKDYSIINGGRCYSKKPPRAKSKYLHWLYGVKRETVPAKKRNRHKTMFFHTNNFMVKREIMMEFPFDESIVGYGYEDLEWAENVFKAGIDIRHIDNPIEHLGLEKAETFLHKAKKSIENLVSLNEQGKVENTQLVTFAERLKKIKLKGLFNLLYGDKLEEYELQLKEGKATIQKLMIFKLLYYYKLTEK